VRSGRTGPPLPLTAPLGAPAGKSEGSSSFILNRPPSKGVPAGGRERRGQDTCSACETNETATPPRTRLRAQTLVATGQHAPGPSTSALMSARLSSLKVTWSAECTVSEHSHGRVFHATRCGRRKLASVTLLASRVYCAGAAGACVHRVDSVVAYDTDFRTNDAP
jgi:hypothetical protein